MRFLSGSIGERSATRRCVDGTRAHSDYADSLQLLFPHMDCDTCVLLLPAFPAMDDVEVGYDTRDDHRCLRVLWIFGCRRGNRSNLLIPLFYYALALTQN